MRENRRAVMKGIGAGISGFAGIGLAGPVAADVQDTPEWTVSNSVEGDNVVASTVEVGYFGSILGERWIGGTPEERWQHFIEVSFVATTTAGNYGIAGQKFDTRFYSGTELNQSPNAGSTAWPYPNSGNWANVLDALVENALGELTIIASIPLAAEDVLDAYDYQPFDTEDQGKIQFVRDYGIHREHCSHSVRFVADQVPGTDGMVDILCAADDHAFGYVGNWIYMYPDGGDLPEPPQYDNESSGSATPMMDMLDQMSTSELAEYGIERVEPGETKSIGPRRTVEPEDRPRYVTTFDVDCEFGAEGGRVVNKGVTHNSSN